MQFIKSKTGFCLVLLAVTSLMCGCKSNDYQVIQSQDSSIQSSSDVISDNGEDDSLTDIGDAGSDSDSSLDTGGAAVDASDESIVVYVCGAVNNSGVYELLADSRIADAVDAAGGFSDDADREYLNLAMVVSDGMKIKVPTVDETKELSKSKEQSFAGGNASPGDAGSNTDDCFVVTGDGEAVDTNQVTSENADSDASASDSSKVNINTATAQQLCTLSGIGQSRADAIIAYREEHGPFQTIEDIKKVSGIKDKVFEQIKDNITV